MSMRNFCSFIEKHFSTDNLIQHSHHYISAKPLASLWDLFNILPDSIIFQISGYFGYCLLPEQICSCTPSKTKTSREVLSRV